MRNGLLWTTLQRGVTKYPSPSFPGDISVSPKVEIPKGYGSASAPIALCFSMHGLGRRESAHRSRVIKQKIPIDSYAIACLLGAESSDRASL